MTPMELSRLVSACQYKPGWRVAFRLDNGHRPYIQVEVDQRAEASVDHRTGLKTPWKGGKTYLSPHMCRQEVVSAVFAALMKAEEHESREWFTYRGKSIFNPHIDPDAMVEMLSGGLSSGRRVINLRENAMTMEEAP